MKKTLILLALLCCTAEWLAAQEAADLPPPITLYNRDAYLGTNHYTVGDIVISEDALGSYLMLNNPTAAIPYNQGLKMKRKRWQWLVLGAGGLALSLFAKNENMETAGWALQGLSATGEFLWINAYQRKMDLGIDLYNQVWLEDAERQHPPPKYDPGRSYQIIGREDW